MEKENKFKIVIVLLMFICFILFLALVTLSSEQTKNSYNKSEYNCKKTQMKKVSESKSKIKTYCRKYCNCRN